MSVAALNETSKLPPIAKKKMLRVAASSFLYLTLIPDDRLELAADLKYHVAVTFAYVGNNLEQTQKYQEAV